MRAALPISIGAAPQAEHQDDLRCLVEIDRRRASIGLHAATDPTRSARTMTSLWLAVDHAERLGQDLLAAVAAARAPGVGVDQIDRPVAVLNLTGAR